MTQRSPGRPGSNNHDRRIAMFTEDVITRLCMPVGRGRWATDGVFSAQWRRPVPPVRNAQPAAALRVMLLRPERGIYLH